MLHPGLAADFGYDSNVFYNADAKGAGLMRLRAHLDLATLPPQYFENDDSAAVRKVDFRLSTQVEYREYLTSDSQIQQERSVNVLVDMGLTILPTGPFTLTIADSFLRTVDPRNFEATAVQQQMGVANFSRDYNRAALTGAYQTAGDTFEIGAGGTFDLNHYENPDMPFANNYLPEGQVFAKWHFLPRSSVGAIVRVGYNDYISNPTINGIPVRAVAQFSSLFSTWFGFSVTAGYGNSVSSTGPSYNMFIGGADLKFIMPFRSTINVIYDRDFYSTMFANYFADDHIGLLYDQPLLRWLKASLEGGVRFRHYDGLAPASTFSSAWTGYSSPTTRDDIVYTLRAEVMFRATNWLAFAVNYNLLVDSTNFAIMEGGSAVPLNYVKNSVFGRFDIAY